MLSFVQISLERGGAGTDWTLGLVCCYCTTEPTRLCGNAELVALCVCVCSDGLQQGRYV